MVFDSCCNGKSEREKERVHNVGEHKRDAASSLQPQTDISNGQIRRERLSRPITIVRFMQSNGHLPFRGTCCEGYVIIKITAIAHGT